MKRLQKLQRRHVMQWSIIVLFVLLLIVYEISFKYGFYYARGRIYFALTDGFLILPSGNGQLDYGDWGLLTEPAWDVSSHCICDVVPRHGLEWPFRGPVLLLPFMFAFLWIFVALAVVMPGMIAKLPRKTLNAIGLWGLVAYFLVVLIHHNFLSENLQRALMPLECWVPIVWIPACWLSLKEDIKERYLPAGLCRICKYNLTGNISGICPECGSAVAGK